MNPFLNETIAGVATQNTGRHFPLSRAEKLRSAFVGVFSRHMGRLRSGAWFEGELLLVTGLSESGKTCETNEILKTFHASPALLPSGAPARIVQCELSRTGGWKDLGRKTLTAMGYELADRARLNQTEIWSRVAHQAEVQGIIGIHYDEAQHIFAKKSDEDKEMILDSFKTLLKTPRWPLMLIMSGVPELARHLSLLDQTQTKVTHVHFPGIVLPDDYDVIHEIVGTYAIENGLSVDADLMTEEFYHRLATAVAFRWGTLIKMTIDTIGIAQNTGSAVLTRENYVDFWVDKTDMNPLATPFTHEGYETLFRPDKPFEVSIS